MLKVIFVGLLLLGSVSTKADEDGVCTVSWDASPSQDVVHYTVLIDGVAVGTTSGLELELADKPCSLGSYTATATNSQGVQSEPSTAYLVTKPEPPTGLFVWLSNIIDAILGLF